MPGVCLSLLLGNCLNASLVLANHTKLLHMHAAIFDNLKSLSRVLSNGARITGTSMNWPFNPQGDFKG